MAVAVESVFGDVGTLYSDNQGSDWFVKYEDDATCIPWLSSIVPLTAEQALGTFELAKDTILSKFERRGKDLLEIDELSR